ncbi:MAG: hypothetical protein HETSPECPRED_009981 [Heterodermia speciosa]|uniref:Carbohydrate esterase family 16 protein n=1 Tax=Heterodermia speciosa TaxID=116794 RepID=A0A8H3IWU4_9LECA|nr:MAG: hypothetical protein HETSPECPRED_009981 [Heterodermia speciosa]
MKPRPKHYILTTLLASPLSALPSAPLTHPRPPLTLFTFGDSYSSTGFSPLGPPPSFQNPLGNPEYPGITTIGTADYTSLLPSTTTLNHSSLRLYNLACGGATIDDRIVATTDPPWRDDRGVPPYCEEVGALSLRKQVEDIFLPYYGPTGARKANWDPNHTVFTLWFGVNDVLHIEDNVRKGRGTATAYIHALMASYTASIAKLYAAGSRRVLIFNVPPLDRLPPSSTSSPSILIPTIITQLNSLLTTLTSHPHPSFPLATLTLLDAHALFSSILDHPAAFGIKNTTGACPPYAFSREEELWVEGCGVRRREYFWADGLHPTSTVQRVLAGEVGRVLAGDREMGDGWSGS